MDSQDVIVFGILPIGKGDNGEGEAIISAIISLILSFFSTFVILRFIHLEVIQMIGLFIFFLIIFICLILRYEGFLEFFELLLISLLISAFFGFLGYLLSNWSFNIAKIVFIISFIVIELYFIKKQFLVNFINLF